MVHYYPTAHRWISIRTGIGEPVLDAEGRVLSPVKADIVALDDHMVLLMSDYNPKSFDARYFGLMDKSQVISAVLPLWKW